MEPADFLIELSHIVGVDEAVSVVSALRQEHLLWEYISNKNNLQVLLGLVGTDAQSWNLAYLTLKILGVPNEDINNISNENMNPIDTSLQRKALGTYEDTLQNNLIPKSLAEIGLIALALRERRRLTHTWVGLSQELLNKNPENGKHSFLVWKTSLACVFGMVFDRSDFLLSLYSNQFEDITLAWIINSVLCYPLKPAEQSLLLIPVLEVLGYQKKVEFIKNISQQGRTDLAKKLADYLIHSPGFIDVSASSIDRIMDQDALLSQSSRANQNSQLYFLSLNTKKALNSLYTAKRLSQNYLESLDIQIVGINDKDNISRNAVTSLSKIENAHSLPRYIEEELLFSVEPDSVTNLFNLRDLEISNPLLIIKKAWLLAREGEKGEAQEIARKALNQLIGNSKSNVLGGNKLFYPKLLLSWEPNSIVNWLIDLGMLTEALDFGLTLLEEQPADWQLILITSRLYQALGDFEQGIHYALIGIALKPENPKGHRRLAELYESNHNFSKAFDEWQKVLRYAEQPDSSDWLSFSSNALNVNQPQLAIDGCKIVLENDNENGQALILLGTGYRAIGEIGQAVLQIEKATSLMPFEEKPWLLLVELYTTQGNKSRVADALRAAVKVLPDSKEINYQLANVCLAQGLSAEALGYSQKVLDLSPDEIQNTILHATILRSLGKFWESKNILSKGILKFGKNIDLAFLYGQVLLDLGEREYAIPFLKLSVDIEIPDVDKLILYASALVNGENLLLFPEEFINTPALSEVKNILDLAILLSPENFYINLLTAEVYLVSDKFDTALDIYKKLNNYPESMKSEWRWRVKTGLGWLALKIGDSTAALVSLQEAISEKPTCISILHLLSEAFYKARFLDNAFETANRSRLLAPEDKKNLVWLSEFFVLCERYQEANEAIESLIELDPENIYYYIKLAKNLIVFRKEKLAHQTLEKLLKDKKIGSKDLQEISHVMVSLGDKLGALACLERIGLEKPSEIQKSTNLEIAFLLWELNRPDESITILKQMLAKDPIDVQVNTLLADILVDTGNYQDAAIGIRNVLDSIPTEGKKNADLEYLLGNIGWKLSRKTIKAYQGKAELFFKYSILLSKTGKYDEAIKYAQKALEIEPNHLVLRYLLMDLTMGSGDENKINEFLPILGAWVEEPVNNKKENYFTTTALVEIICQQIEVNINNPENGFVENLFKTGLEIRNDHPRLLGDKASWLAVSGDWENEEKAYQTFEEVLNRTKQESGSNWYDIYLFKYNVDDFSRVWIAETYLVTQHWEKAFKFYNNYVENKKWEPRGWKGFRNALQKGDRWNKFYSEIQSVSHAPSKILIGKYQQKIADILLLYAQDTDLAYVNQLFEKNPRDGNYFTESLDVCLGRLNKILGSIRNCLPETAYQVGEEINQFSLGRKTDPVNNVLSAIYHEKIENWEKGLQSILTALAVWQKEPEWWIIASNFSDKTKQYHLSIQYLEKANEIEFYPLDYAILLATALIEHGDLQKAIKYLENIYLKYPENANLGLTLSRAYQKSGQNQKALDLAVIASEKDLNSPEAFMLCGEIAIGMRKYDQALEFTRKAQNLFPLFLESILLESKVLINMGKLDSALNLLEKREFDGSLTVKLERIRLTRQLRGDQSVLNMVEELGKQYPDNIDVLVVLAQVELACGMFENANETARNAIFQHPDNIPMNILLARQCGKSGQLDQAIYYFSTAINQLPLDMELYLEMGEIYKERRENLQAIQTYQKAIKVIPGDYRPYFQSALVLRESKDYQGAEIMLRKAVGLAPENIIIRKQLSAIIALNLIHNPQEV